MLMVNNPDTMINDDKKCFSKKWTNNDDQTRDQHVINKKWTSKNKGTDAPNCLMKSSWSCTLLKTSMEPLSFREAKPARQ